MYSKGLSINQKKAIKSLHLSKYRQKYDKFIAEGHKIAKECIMQGIDQLENVFALPEWIAQNADLLAPIATYVVEINEKELSEISLLQTPNQVLVVMRAKPIPKPEPDQWMLYADNIRDPGNMGTLLRIADWFGINMLAISPEATDAMHPKVVQASMGAFLRVHAPVCTLHELQQILPNAPIYGAVFNGQSLYSIQNPQKGIIVIGAESDGIQAENERLITYPVTIEGAGGAESLNAAVAAGVICSWLTHQ